MAVFGRHRIFNQWVRVKAFVFLIPVKRRKRCLMLALLMSPHAIRYQIDLVTKFRRVSRRRFTTNIGDHSGD